MGFFDSLASPQDKSHFSVKIHDDDWAEEWSDLVSAQTAKLQVNFVKRKLKFWLRQTKKGIIQDVLFRVLSHERGYGRIDHIVIKPSTKADYEYHFRRGIVIDHNCEFAYTTYDNTGKERAAKGPLLHELTLEFDEVELITPARDQKTRTLISKPKEILKEG